MEQASFKLAKLTNCHCLTSGGWTRSAKHDGAIARFELSCNEPSYCADLEERKKNQLQELEIRKMEVSPILVVKLSFVYI